jgi:hypothetical protein
MSNVALQQHDDPVMYYMCNQIFTGKCPFERKKSAASEFENGFVMIAIRRVLSFAMFYQSVDNK